jgi:hypothetical protein
VPITRQKSPVFSIVSLPTDSVIVDHAVEDMNLFVTLNVATFKNILCIPIVCKYLIFVVSMEMRGKNQSHVAARYLR